MHTKKDAGIRTRKLGFEKLVLDENARGNIERDVYRLHTLEIYVSHLIYHYVLYCDSTGSDIIVFSDNKATQCSIVYRFYAAILNVTVNDDDVLALSFERFKQVFPLPAKGTFRNLSNHVRDYAVTNRVKVLF